MTKITFELSSYDADEGEWDERPPARHCDYCVQHPGSDPSERGEMVRFAKSWYHRPCLERFMAEKIATGSLAAAWVLIAIEVAQRPHKHTSATIRATLQSLLAMPHGWTRDAS